SSPAWSDCEALIKAFERAWLRDGAPAIEDYLRADGRERQALMVELVHVDLEFRLKAGESVRMETYLSRFPQLAGSRETILDLLAAEYELRQRYQGDVGLDEYSRRFPEYREALRQRLTDAERDTPGPSADPALAGPSKWPMLRGYEIEEQL